MDALLTPNCVSAARWRGVLRLESDRTAMQAHFCMGLIPWTLSDGPENHPEIPKTASVCDGGGLAIGPRASVRPCVRHKVLHGALRQGALERPGVRVSNARVPGARGLSRGRGVVIVVETAVVGSAGASQMAGRPRCWSREAAVLQARCYR